MSSGGFKALFEFAAAVDNPRQVGRVLARCRPGLDEQVLTAMDSAHEAVTQVALGYFGHRFLTMGWGRRGAAAQGERSVTSSHCGCAARASPSGACLDSGRSSRCRSRSRVLEPCELLRPRNPGRIRPAARGVSPATCSRPPRTGSVVAHAACEGIRVPS